MRYTLRQEPLEGQEGFHLSFQHRDRRPLSWAEILQAWQQDADFQTHFSTALATVSYAAYFWETPPLTQTQSSQPFTCVVINSPALARVNADYGPFVDYLRPSPQAPDIRAFPNLGGDAQLIAPCPVGVHPNYTHLAAFLRQAPMALQRELWATLSQAIQSWLEDQGNRPLWVSTSGLGVFWLHLRLDTVPKYYQYAPYRKWAGN